MRNIGDLMASTRAGRAKREGCQSADATHRRIQTGYDHHPAAGGHVHGVRGLGAHGADLSGRQPHRCGRPERRRSDQSAHVLHKHSDESGDAVYDDCDDHDVVGLRAPRRRSAHRTVRHAGRQTAGHRRQGRVHRLQLPRRNIWRLTGVRRVRRAIRVPATRSRRGCRGCRPRWRRRRSWRCRRRTRSARP